MYTRMDPNEYKLDIDWMFYIHLQSSSAWGIESYYPILKLENLKDLVLISREMNFELMKKTLFFFMKGKIKPMWEDEHNCQGGGFSFKISNKQIEPLWRKLLFLLIGGTITKDKEVNDHITGISLSPKKSFCILKIWMKTCKYVNAGVFIDIEGLDKKTCLFKPHGKE